jgi:hypothetical protein
MNEPEKHYKSSAVFSIYAINKLKDGLGGWKVVSVSVNNHAVCFEVYYTNYQTGNGG